MQMQQAMQQLQGSGMFPGMPDLVLRSLSCACALLHTERHLVWAVHLDAKGTEGSSHHGQRCLLGALFVVLYADGSCDIVQCNLPGAHCASSLIHTNLLHEEA